MKRCPNCNQTYTDESLNFCLSDGGTLIKVGDDAPPTIFMNQARTTNQTSWANNDPFTPPTFGQMSPWQNQSASPNAPFMGANMYQSPNQTLPVISLILGILSCVICCYGMPFGVAALVTGFIGFNNAGKDPVRYGGRGLALAGIIFGAFSVFIMLFFILIGILGN